MPKAFRTDMRVSGRPGAGSDPTMACTEFIGPPRSSAARRERPSHTRIPGARKKRALAAMSLTRQNGAPVPRAPTLQSDELIGAQKIVGLDDLAQSVFRRTIAPVRVRMMAFDQFLVSRLDLRWGRVAAKFERQQRLDRQGVVPRRGLGLRRLAFCSAPPRRAGLGKNGFIDRAGRPPRRARPSSKLDGGRPRRLDGTSPSRRRPCRESSHKKRCIRARDRGKS